MIIDTLGYTSAKQKTLIACICDYCGEQFERMKHNLERSRKHSQTDSCSNPICVQKKRIESNKIIFGTENAFQNKDVKNKISKTNKERYGVENVFQNDEIRKKQKETCLQKYGVENVFQNNEIKEKIKKSHLVKHLVENAFQNKDIQEKQRKTLTDRYGFPYALQNDELRKKAMETCISNHGCFPANNYGKAQKDIQDWLNSFGFNFSSNRDLIPGKEIDLYEPNKKIAIEYCGLHWHNELSPEPRKRQYHISKHNACVSQGVQLLTIFSDEWEKRNSQCKSHIKSLLGINEKRIYARKCNIKEIDRNIGCDFFEKYHIQGKNKLGTVFFSLFYEDDLVGSMSLGRHNRQYDNLVLDRLCFKDGIQIVGGASKLFSKCIEWAKTNNYTEILSFSDNRWSIGKVYEALNFTLDKETGPDYSYVDIKRPNERISKQSQKKDAVNCPEGLTEYEWAKLRGLARIWDCGKKRWIYKI